MEIRRFTLNNNNNIVVPSPKSDSLSYNNKEEFEVGFVLLDLLFYMYVHCCVDRCLFFFF